MNFRKPTLVIACLAALSSAAIAQTTQPSDISFLSDAYAHHFTADRGVMTLAIRKGLRVAGGQVRVTDELGRVVKEIPIVTGHETVPIELSEKGYYRIDATVQQSDGPPLNAVVTASVVGVLLPNDVRMKSPFGFFSVRGDTPLPVVAGSAWNRLFIPTNAVQKGEDGAFKWAGPREPGPRHPLTFQGQPSPLRWVGVFMYPPPATVAPERREKLNNHNVSPPQDWDAFRQAVLFAAKHYAPWVEYYEPINEPDANWRGTDEELVRYHRVIAEAVREANPNGKVVGPCLSSVDLPQLRKLASMGLFDHLDGISIHAYANDAPPEGKWWSGILEVRSLLKSLGKEDVPLIVSEYGWQTQDGDWARPVDPLSQARYAARSLTLLVSQQVDAINYFCLRYDDPKIPFVQGWSVVEKDNTPRPAFVAISNVSRWLADVQGRGTVLHPAPNTYLVLFKRGTGTIAVAWTTRGESSFQIPGTYKRLNDMMGRAVTPDASGRIRLSESPLFIELDDGKLPEIRMGEAIQVVRGSTANLAGHWANASLPAPLALENNRLTVPDTAPAGDYLVFARDEKGDWSAAPIQVLPRFVVESAKIVWPQDRSKPIMRLSIKSHGKQVNVLPVVRFDGLAPRFGERVDVPADRAVSVDVSLAGIPLDRRWTGTAAVEARSDGRVEVAQTAAEVAVLPGGYVDAGTSVDWSKLPVVRSNGWTPFATGSVKNDFGPEDCSAELQWAWSETGLHFNIRVRDDEHLQVKEPQQMWQQDSLQLAFDVDADKPWQMNLNNDLVGLNGHRVFEYGVSLRDGHEQTARWREAIVKLPDRLPEIVTNIKRDDAHTSYELTFPWPVLGLARAPEEGTSIGFDLAINDADTPPRARHGLEIFGGIQASKDPERYGRLLLRR